MPITVKKTTPQEGNRGGSTSMLERRELKGKRRQSFGQGVQSHWA